MKPKSDSVTGKGPQTSGRCPSGGQSASDVFGFPISANQFQDLQTELEKLWKLNAEIIPVVVGALGNVSHNLKF